MINVKIESGISIPDSNFAKGYGKYPWRNMQQGDSFFISEKIFD